jgi:hypothetical protein
VESVLSGNIAKVSTSEPAQTTLESIVTAQPEVQSTEQQKLETGK